MKVLVTGGTGFVGRPTAIDLRRRGHDVTVTGRKDTGPSWATDAGVIYAQADLSSGPATDALLSSHAPDVVVHLAWYTRPGSYLTSRSHNVASLAASVHLLAAAERADSRHVVLGGTCLESSVSASNTVYARMKRALHDIASEYFDAGHPSVMCAHIFSAYGPGEHPDRVIPSTIRSLIAGQEVSLTDGSAQRDYVHVEDVASALATIAETAAGGEVDICSGTSRAVREVLSALGRLMGREELLRFGDIPQTSTTDFDVEGSTTRLESLGWAPRYTLEEGLRSSVEWWSRTLASGSRTE